MNAPLEVDFQETTGTESVLNSQLQLLRSRVEAELGKPSVILVTSAADRDGTSLTAYSLASCFVKSGHRAALVALTPSGGERHDVTMIDFPHQDGSAIERERLAKFVEELRSSQDFTVVDAGTLLGSASAMALASMVDGILLAVRVGRAPTDEDELMMQTIAHSRGHVLGVVATSEEAVAEFERMQAGDKPAAYEGLPRGVIPMRPRSYALSGDSLAQLDT
jgi:Mrp family chromosome partitioning ATPase